MMNTVKLYGKVLRTWKHVVTCATPRGIKYEEERTSQYEVAYTEYLDGEMIAKGSEDFSPERYCNIKMYRVFTWDGSKRNAGGNRWFEEVGRVKVARGNKAAALAIVKKWYPDAAVVELR